MIFGNSGEYAALMDNNTFYEKWKSSMTTTQNIFVWWIMWNVYSEWL